MMDYLCSTTITRNVGRLAKKVSDLFYEGDIVRAVGFSGWIGIAKFSDKNQAFVFECVDKNYRGNIVFMSQFDQGFKILGNIYENPGLLEELTNDN